MTPISQYSTKADYERLLLQGPPGSGKTTLACSFPAPYFIDIDVNLAGPLRYRTKRQLSLPVGYDRLDVDDDGKPIKGVIQKFNRLDKLLLAAQANTEIQTIVLDSATGLSSLMLDKTALENPTVKDGRQLFGFFLKAGLNLIGTLTAMQKNMVLTAHEVVDVDAMTGAKQYRVMWPGQLHTYMSSFFTNAWRTEVVSDGYPPKFTYKVRTMQDASYYGLKNNYELPYLIDQDKAIAVLQAAK
jgi:DNA polymerase III delta prime subunit